MSDFPTPPRGRGKHWRDYEGGEVTRYEPGRVDTSGYLPRIQEPTRDVVDSNPNLYRVDVPGPLRDPDPGRARVNSGDRRSVLHAEGRTDLVVPRVYLEPDEWMDKLRARALRFAIARDVVLIIIGLSFMWRLVILPLWLALGG
jgi:hypothetical protein